MKLSSLFPLIPLLWSGLTACNGENSCLPADLACQDASVTADFTASVGPSPVQVGQSFAVTGSLMNLQGGKADSVVVHDSIGTRLGYRIGMSYTLPFVAQVVGAFRYTVTGYASNIDNTYRLSKSQIVTQIVQAAEVDPHFPSMTTGDYALELAINDTQFVEGEQLTSRTCSSNPRPIYVNQTPMDSLLGAVVNGTLDCSKIAANGGSAVYQVFITSTTYNGYYLAHSGTFSLTGTIPGPPQIYCTFNGQVFPRSSAEQVIVLGGTFSCDNLGDQEPPFTGTWTAS